MRDISILALEWDNFNETHIWERHQLTRAEVEEVCYGNPEHIKVEDAKEGRIRIIGPRQDGRLLVIILSSQGNGVFYPVTARPPKRQEVRRYDAWRTEKEQ